MIKVYVNNEYYTSFQTEEQLDKWVQSMEDDFFLNNNVEIKRVEAK